MELDERTWYSYNTDIDNLQNALLFLGGVPSNLKFIFAQESFIMLFDEFTKDIHYDHFMKSFYEAGEILVNSLGKVKDNLHKEEYRRALYFRLAENGLTENSFTFKINLLNLHWKRAYSTVKDGIIDFANSKTVGLFRKVFEFLNSILGSFASIIPGVDAIKEIKEIGESLIGLAEK